MPSGKEIIARLLGLMWAFPQWPSEQKIYNNSSSSWSGQSVSHDTQFKLKNVCDGPDTVNQLNLAAVNFSLSDKFEW